MSTQAKTIEQSGEDQTIRRSKQSEWRRGSGWQATSSSRVMGGWRSSGAGIREEGAVDRLC
ncbi:unnamed protein product [Linum tenue]|uniref:Uncharacterized protein n=1 Tax=Linum tenue TaxID=586396 RepID=A0AAV0L6Q4_9ROSI|nr:unnamed protein product [Linum tenue]